MRAVPTPRVIGSISAAVTGALVCILHHHPLQQERNRNPLGCHQPRIVFCTLSYFTVRGSGICLAVLHPRRFAVYSLQAVGSSYLQHSKIYEHWLEHTAANMVTGGFGGVAGEC
eukprot:GHUV01055465.1.p1 GENE.GHUV01055465.1~~GHUV01055465.1.p1  ORF type:complete len:114 (-),score=15.27 GHUV01055465.1:318-659(-)